MFSGSRPQVLLAVENLKGGGAERVVVELARNWPRDHFEPVILVASLVGEYIADLPPDLEVIEVGIASSPRNTLAFLSRLRERLRSREVAGVVSHLTGMNRMLLRASLAGVIKAPIVVVEHNDFLRNQGLARMGWLRSFLLRSETAMLYRRAHGVVGCSRGVASQVGEMFGITPGKLHAIPNPLDSRFMQPVETNTLVESWLQRLPRPVFVSVGRLVPQKAFHDLIGAFALQKSGSLIILGEGPQRSSLETFAIEQGVAERTLLPGFVRSPQTVLQVSDVYVSSSLWEGYPLTLLEAYASGLPVVARACNFGPEEIVTQDRPGRLVRSNNVEDLANAMEEVALTESRFPVGTTVDLSENNPLQVAKRYCNLFATRCESF